MTLVENTLFGKRDKVATAIERLRTYEPKDGYHLAFSGGKDSVTILLLAQMAGVKFDAHYNDTTVDPPELVRFIREQHPEVERHRPEMSMFQLILKVKLWPPMRQQRWCCELLKEGGGAGCVVMTGIRWEESAARNKRRMIEACFKDGSKTYLHPIIDWTSDDVWQFIRRENVPYCSLYDEGFERLGCILCPMECNPANIQMQMDRWPKFVRAYVNTFDKLIRVRAERGKSTTFKTGQDVFDWWIDRRKCTRHSEAQMVLFE
ncbi:MAG: phosphoadenosine phosphosulfate reductase family protein [Ardenticatenia bacterium]|nr:phosphoadenosine phosphosulfate reductase family protein [Ardenticatenia bacterium]